MGILSESAHADESRPDRAAVVPADQAALARAAETLRAGGLVCFPTDTVYGVGAALSVPSAIERLFTAKLRPRSKPIPVLVASAEDLEQLASSLSDEARTLAARWFPGALTLVVRARPGLPAGVVARNGTVAVRAPNHPVPLALLRAVGGPLATTSANISGALSATTAAEALRDLGAVVDLVIDGGAAPGGVPSSIVDVSVSPPTLLRAGGIPYEVLLESCPTLSLR